MWLTLQKPRMSDSSKDSKKQNEKRKPMFFIFLSYLREGKIVLCQKRKLREGTLAPPHTLSYDFRRSTLHVKKGNGYKLY